MRNLCLILQICSLKVYQNIEFVFNIQCNATKILSRPGNLEIEIANIAVYPLTYGVCGFFLWNVANVAF